MDSAPGAVCSCDSRLVPAITASNATDTRAAICVDYAPRGENVSMQRIPWTLALLITVSGCSAEPPAERPERNELTPPSTERRDPWREAAERGIDFRAIGQEPGWYLEVDDGRSMRLVYDYGERNVITPAPVATTDTERTKSPG